LSTKTARKPSAKSFRREDRKAMRYSVFITPLSWKQPDAGLHMLLNLCSIGKENYQKKKEKEKEISSKLTVDNSLSSFPWADATLEKCFCVKQSENGAPFPRP